MCCGKYLRKIEKRKIDFSEDRCFCSKLLIEQYTKTSLFFWTYSLSLVVPASSHIREVEGLNRIVETISLSLLFNKDPLSKCEKMLRRCTSKDGAKS